VAGELQITYRTARDFPRPSPLLKKKGEEKTSESKGGKHLLNQRTRGTIGFREKGPNQNMERKKDPIILSGLLLKPAGKRENMAL